MLASPGRLPTHEEEWGFEIKWDGIRALAFIDGGRIRLVNRNERDVTKQYPELRALGPELGSHEAILDGEIVSFDEHGYPSFEQLQRRMHLSAEGIVRRRAREAPVTYVIFDLLYLDGRSTTGLSYRDRRALLEGFDLRGPAWQTPAYYAGEGRELLTAAGEQRLEGVLAKRLDSPYRSGRRTTDWLKIKNVNRQELVIGGWLPGKGNRAKRLGALLMGYYESNEHGESLLRYAGRVGTGFDEEQLEQLGRELAARRRESSPFSGTQPPREARFVQPELVAEVEFRQWTRERILRHSSYKGLRDDKPAEDVHREMPDPGAGAYDEVGIETQKKTIEISATRAAETRERPNKFKASEQARGKPYKVLHETKRAAEIEVEGRTLKLTNRGKVLYPRAGFTKGELIDYYAAIAPVLLPHLIGRPLTLKRYPDGVEGSYFYEKRCPTHRPSWVRTATIHSDRATGTIDYCLAEDLPTLIWAANLADIELHTSLSRAKDMTTPTAIVFDLDPGAPAGLKQCCRVALWVREIIDAIGLRAYVKTSGSKGLQVYVPLNTPVGYEQTKPFAHAVAKLLEKRHPRHVLSRMAKDHRTGKVLVDWSQNDQHKTTVCVYSLRARERPTISTPLTWEEVEQASRSRRELELSAEPSTLLQRVEHHGDLFEPLLTLTQELPDLSAGLEAPPTPRKPGPVSRL
jgi:bifunctional non-homologous end joining protein LigD